MNSSSVYPLIRSSMTYLLHPRLEADTHPVAPLPLCDVRIQDNRLFPWLVLVPRRADISEIIGLTDADQTLLMQEIAQASRALQTLFSPDKLNVAALGNVVPQLHVHVIARFKTDVMWDKPVWGGPTEPYIKNEREALCRELEKLLSSSRLDD
jgi:diadenosine tetraphosphate (Ap4A) HIT family hydrolase